MPGGRQPVASNVFLTLDGVKCGPVRRAEGGFVSGDVVIDTVGGTGGIPKQRIGSVRYEPFVVDVGLSMEPPVYAWVAESWTTALTQKNGSLVTADYKLEAKQEREFFNALLTETTFPALDAAAKDPGFLTLRIQPELTKETSAAGKQNGVGTKAKQWLRNGFRLQIDGLDCTKVSKIESFSVKQALASQSIGETRVPDVLGARLIFPNLQITLSAVSAKTWFDWHEDFVIKGKNDASAERSGTIQLLAVDAKTELARIKLFGLGIFRIASSVGSGGADKVQRVVADLYCERMELVVKP